ncbi:MAG TPA: hypothetical protein VMT53_23970 [Terriglobales bacterium]|nr:hypothetical protein [Terriglobales bacterium]
MRSLYRVPGMQLKAVAFLRAHDGARASLGTNRMGPHDLHLRHDANVDRTPGAHADFHRSTQPCQAGSEDQDIMSRFAHSSHVLYALPAFGGEVFVVPAFDLASPIRWPNCGRPQ